MNLERKQSAEAYRDPVRAKKSPPNQRRYEIILSIMKTAE